jgi:hypothetical protein
MGRDRRDNSERVGHRGQGGCVLREVGHIAKGLFTLAKLISTCLARVASYARLAPTSSAQMARIKHIPKRGALSNGVRAKDFSGLVGKFAGKRVPRIDSTPAAPQEQAQRWLFVMEMGASHAQVMFKEPGSTWKYVNWGKGSGASSMGGVDVIPTMTALRAGDGSLEIRHGYSALNARIANRDWVVFQHLKLVYLDVAPTDAMRQTLKSQQEMASAKGWDVQELADKFFYFVLSKATEMQIRPPVLYTNISDVWPNAVAQRLVNGFQKVVPGAEVHGIDECLSSVIGAVSTEPVSAERRMRYIVVDCGHATMVSGLLLATPGSKLKVTSRTLALPQSAQASRVSSCTTTTPTRLVRATSIWQSRMSFAP